MRFPITALFMLFVFFLAVTVNEVEARDNVRNPPCDEVCKRTNREQESCCEAHGFKTGRCKNFESFCDE